MTVFIESSPFYFMAEALQCSSVENPIEGVESGTTA